jgi:outer membrane protein
VLTNNDKETNGRSTQAGFIYGVGLITSGQLYKGFAQRNMFIPLIGYQDEKLKIFGPYISYQIAKFNELSVDFKLSPRFQGYEQSDSDIFIGMQERNNSLDAGIELAYSLQNWQVNITSLFDVLNQSHGYEVKTTISHRYQIGPIFITPQISASLLDNNLVDYYYGVLPEEAKPNRMPFEGQKAHNFSVGVLVATPVFLGGFTRFSIEHQWVDTAISDSPLVDKKTTLSAQLFFTRFF